MRYDARRRIAAYMKQSPWLLTELTGHAFVPGGYFPETDRKEGRGEAVRAVFLREMSSYFVAPAGYVYLAAFYCLAGYEYSVLILRRAGGNELRIYIPVHSDTASDSSIDNAADE